MTTQSEKNTAAIIHLSSFAKYLIPFAGIVVPLIIWQTKKNESEFIDQNGKSVINFHISTFLYGMILFCISAVIFITNIVSYVNLEKLGKEIFPVELVTLFIVGIGILCFYTIVEFILIILGSVKANEGNVYKYPFTINFIK